MEPVASLRADKTLTTRWSRLRNQSWRKMLRISNTLASSTSGRPGPCILCSEPGEGPVGRVDETRAIGRSPVVLEIGVAEGGEPEGRAGREVEGKLIRGMVVVREQGARN